MLIHYIFSHFVLIDGNSSALMLNYDVTMLAIDISYLPMIPVVIELLGCV